MADFRGGNLSQPGASPFPSVAQPVPLPDLSRLGGVIAKDLDERKKAAAANEKAGIFAEVAVQQTEAISDFLNDQGEPLNAEEQTQVDLFNQADNSGRQEALKNPTVRLALDKVQRIGQARRQTRSQEDLERLYLRAADINKRIINDYPQYADVVLTASQAALGFDPLEKAIGLEQAEAIKQLDLERAERKTVIDKAVSSGVVNFRPDGSFNEEDALRKGQALLQQEALLKRSKDAADLLAASKPSEAELQRAKFSGFMKSVNPVIRADIATFGANLLEQSPNLANDPGSAAKIQELWATKRTTFLANQELIIAQIDDPKVQADARTAIEAQLKPYDDLFTGTFSEVQRKKRQLDLLNTDAEIDLNKSAPLVARANRLSGPLAEAVINKFSQSNPEFAAQFAQQSVDFLSGNPEALTPEAEVETFINFAEGRVPLSGLTDKQARATIKNATVSLNAMARNPDNLGPNGLSTYATMASQLTAVADARALPADQLRQAVDTVSSPAKMRMFNLWASSTDTDPESVRELANGIERVNQKNINAQVTGLRSATNDGSSPQFESRFGFTFEGSTRDVAFNASTGRIEFVTTGSPVLPKEQRNILRSINNSLDAISQVSGFTDRQGFSDLQVRQLIADTSGIQTKGTRIALPEATPEAQSAPVQAQPAPRTQQELVDEFIRLGQQGNRQAIEALMNRASGNLALSASPVSFSDAELKGKIDATASSVGVDAALFSRLVKQESGGNPSATSSAGALGLTQLLPSTAASLGVDPNDPDENLFGGALYLRQQIDRFGDTRKALAAYNWGPGNVAKAIRKYGEEWDQHLPKETEDYINRIAPDV